MAKLAERPLAFIDVETTGLDPQRHEVTELAVVFDAHWLNKTAAPWTRRITVVGDAAVYTTKVKPARLDQADPIALQINGYSEYDWAAAPAASAVAPIVAELLGRSGANPIMVGHNVQFDISFLASLLRQGGVTEQLSHRAVDTYTLAFEHLAPCGLDSLSLDNIRKFLELPTQGAHRALKDALDARLVYRRLVRASFLSRWWWKFRNRNK
jgi:DNA polymerase-3 subunit epsilon